MSDNIEKEINPAYICAVFQIGYKFDINGNLQRIVYRRMRATGENLPCDLEYIPKEIDYLSDDPERLDYNQQPVPKYL